MGDTVGKFQKFSAPQILRETGLVILKHKISAILTILATLNFEFFVTFDIFKHEIFSQIKSKPAIVKIAVIDLLKLAKIDFT